MSTVCGKCNSDGETDLPNSDRGIVGADSGALAGGEWARGGRGCSFGDGDMTGDDAGGDVGRCTPAICCSDSKSAQDIARPPTASRGVQRQHTRALRSTWPVSFVSASAHTACRSFGTAFARNTWQGTVRRESSTQTRQQQTTATHKSSTQRNYQVRRQLLQRALLREHVKRL